MKAGASLLLSLAMAVTMTGPARASKPSPAQAAQFSANAKRIDSLMLQASPWKDSLHSAFAGVADSTRDEAVRLVFLTTYKHHVASPAKKATGGAGLHSLAKSFAETWKALAAECGRADLDPLEMAEAVYQFTNSDWAPVSSTKGPGLDGVRTAGDYRKWGRAVLATGKKAKAAGYDPLDVWTRQASSYKVRLPVDLAKVGLNPPRVRF